MKTITISQNRKVFCIGFNKTGTTSLAELFGSLGYRTLHNATWPRWSFLGGMEKSYSVATCYSDGEQANFYRLHQHFSGSLFILNLREVRPWLHSRVKHVMRFGHPDGFRDGRLPRHWGPMAREFFANPPLAIDKWLLVRALYHAQVRDYFADCEQFMEIDVTRTKNWETQIMEMMRSQGFPVIKRDLSEGVHANKRAKSEVPDQDLLAEYLQLADQRLEVLS